MCSDLNYPVIMLHYGAVVVAAQITDPPTKLSKISFSSVAVSVHAVLVTTSTGPKQTIVSVIVVVKRVAAASHDVPSAATKMSGWPATLAQLIRLLPPPHDSITLLITLACAEQFESAVDDEANGVTGCPRNGLPVHSMYPEKAVVVGELVAVVVGVDVAVVVVVGVVVAVEVAVDVAVVVVGVVVAEVVVVGVVVGVVTSQFPVPNPPSSKNPSNIALSSEAAVAQPALATTRAVPKQLTLWLASPSGPLNSVIAAVKRVAISSHLSPSAPTNKSGSSNTTPQRTSSGEPPSSWHVANTWLMTLA